MKIPNLLKCCLCNNNKGNTEVIIKSNCFKKNVIINLNNDTDEHKEFLKIIQKLIDDKPPNNLHHLQPVQV